jgi:hypothetical protein
MILWDRVTVSDDSPFQEAAKRTRGSGKNCGSNRGAVEGIGIADPRASAPNGRQGQAVARSEGCA